MSGACDQRPCVASAPPHAGSRVTSVRSLLLPYVVVAASPRLLASLGWWWVGQPVGRVGVPPGQHGAHLVVDRRHAAGGGEVAGHAEVDGVDVCSDARPVGDDPSAVAPRGPEPVVSAGGG